jgi:protease-4
MALEQKLVDIIAYEDVYHNAIKSVKVEKETITKSVSLITRKNDHHWVSTDSKIKLPLSMRREKFKVEKEMSTLGEGSMRRSLQEARRNKDVKAIVLLTARRKCSYIRFNLENWNSLKK